MGSGPGPRGPSRNDPCLAAMGYRRRRVSGAAVPYYVYLLASRRHGTLYLGVASDLVRRVSEHKTKAVSGFTAKYGVDRLVWFEAHDDPTDAIARERALKKWRRDWKIRLIEEQNPEWYDLFPGIVG